MNKVTTVSHTFSDTDKTISFETGKLALQANGAVVGRLGDTMVLVTATAAKGVREGVDFFPLTVDIEERMYAAGKIPGSFFRREGRASDQAILTARLIDRPLRPSFPKGFRNEVHVVGTILGADLENPHDVLAINCASAALMVSGIPFEGPVGAVRMAFTKQGEWIAHPTYQDGDDSSFELVVAGKMTSDGNDVAIIMVEAGGTTSSWKNVTGGGVPVTEERIAEGLEASKRWIKESIDLQKALVAEVGELPEFAWEPQVDYSEEIFEAVEAAGLEPLRSASITEGKTERQNAIDEVEASVIESLSERFPEEQSQIKAAFRSLLKKVIRDRIVRDGVRIDGRDLTTVRPLYIEVGVVPTAHGSGLFQRGETQVLNICTLGMPKMNQMIDTIGVDDTKRYMHHYNFPDRKSVV